MDDALLVTRARSGDQAAFAALVERHRPLLLALCRRMAGPNGQAEDAAQEAVLQAMLNLDRLRHPARFGSWLAGIGLNVCHRLRRESIPFASWESYCEVITSSRRAGTSPGPEEQVLEAEMIQRVQAAVGALPQGQQAAVLLYYLSGLSQRVTAAVLGIEEGAVKTRVHKARRTLRRTLATIWQEEPMTAETKYMTVTIVDVVSSEEDAATGVQYIVLLQEEGGERGLPVWVGQAEGTGIALLLTDTTMPRPLTYQFLAGAVNALGGSVRETRITRITESVIYAEVLLDGPSGLRSLDARPSDGMALALASGAPIRVEDSLLKSVDTGDRRRNGERSGARALAATAHERVQRQLDPQSSA